MAVHLQRDYKEPAENDVGGQMDACRPDCLWQMVCTNTGMLLTMRHPCTGFDLMTQVQEYCVLMHAGKYTLTHADESVLMHSEAW